MYSCLRSEFERDHESILYYYILNQSHRCSVCTVKFPVLGSSKYTSAQNLRNFPLGFLNTMYNADIENKFSTIEIKIKSKLKCMNQSLN